MNERIQELALQAGEWVNQTWAPPVRSKEPGKIWEDGHVDWHHLFHQKFAELIVEECLMLAHERQQMAPSDDDGYFKVALDMVSSDIKQHFGIE